MDRSPASVRLLPFVVLLLVILGPQRPVSAQVCNAWICNLVTACAAGNPTCTPSGCTCVLFCNRNFDCNRGETCVSGRCAPSPLACENDSDCSTGMLCGPRAVCETAPPTPCTDAGCDDKNPCNGKETCDGFTCRRGAPVSCDDGNSVTFDLCEIDRSKPEGYRCENSGPDKCSAVPLRQPTLRISSPRQLGHREFVLTGILETRFSKKPPTDLPSSSIRVVLGDKSGKPILDTTVEGLKTSSAKEGWSQDPKRGWRYENRAPDAPISRMTFRDPAVKQFGMQFEVVGRLPPGAVPRFGSFATGGALMVDWTGDISGPCGAILVPVCGMRNIGGQDWMYCRGKSIVP